MTTTNSLETLKTAAKKLARAKRIKHFVALDQIARQLKYPHWNALTAGYKNGWRPSSAQITATLQLLDAADPLSTRKFGSAAWDTFSSVPGLTFEGFSGRSADDHFSAEMAVGELDGHKFRLVVSVDDVFLEGRGWQIRVREAPSAEPEIRVTDKRIKRNPIADVAFCDKALAVAQIRAEQVRARIALDWPRRSTVPDAAGNTTHPLFGGVGKKWFCLHCDGSFTGKQMAQNLWHCPTCSATPIDIHTSRWWIGQEA